MTWTLRSSNSSLASPDGYVPVKHSQRRRFISASNVLVCSNSSTGMVVHRLDAFAAEGYGRLAATCREKPAGILFRLGHPSNSLNLWSSLLPDLGAAMPKSAQLR